VSGAQWVRLPLTELGERLGCFRITRRQAVSSMEASLRSYGQLSSIAVCRAADDTLECVDGFKRLHAARRIEGMTELQARVLPVDARRAKVAMLELNRSAGSVNELEEALVVQSLYREDKLIQAEIGELLGRGVSWVSRRLKLLDDLCEELLEQWRLGLITTTEARELVRLPRGKQEAVLGAARRHGLRTRRLGELIDRYLAADSAGREKLLHAPLSALDSAAQPGAHTDPRLSAEGNRVRRCLEQVVVSCDVVQRCCSLDALHQLAPADAPVLEEHIARARRSLARGLSTLEAAPAAWCEADERLVS
jgi:ParB-like chromosome segregation protein Spo0J